MLKRFVYVLRNDEVPPRYYTGLTANVAIRLAIHNAGHCRHTATVVH
jgi:predicted GIY-YIG superfamily endonuclease